MSSITGRLGLAVVSLLLSGVALAAPATAVAGSTAPTAAITAGGPVADGIGWD
ncbi:hypothetical protein [Kitasatospora paranensis]|uniref:Uncharacterized protein n=1 Tax=Kitasatospora paranensis TaxID=258053 RepID=A0ABW2FSG9_9ACTN